MTAEQLQNARASAWRQTGNALLTADDATAWLREAGVALFLPRTQQIAAPAGSFAEAVLGKTDATPDAATLGTAFDLLQRLIASGDAIALNLLGVPGDRPDYLATPETLPFVFALRGDREWKRGPRGKSSPLVVEVWKVLEREGAMTAEAIKDMMGRQLTETAALRALTDLWSNLRIEPVFHPDGKTTEWQCLEAGREAAMQAGSAMSQGTALSALVSLYLQSAVAATLDEIEAFLSPIASRSRVRDAVRGLTATRQLGVRNLGPREHFFVEGSLPEFAEEFDDKLDGSAQADELEAAGSDDASEVKLTEMAAFDETGDEISSPPGLIIEASDDEAEIGDGRKRFVAQRQARATGKDRRSFAPGSSRPSTARPSTPRPGTDRPKTASGERPFFAREPWKEDRKLRPSAGEERPGAGGRKASRPPFGDKRPFVPDGEERRPFSADKPPFAKRTGSGESRPFTPGRRKFEGESASGERKPFGEKRPYAPRDRAAPFARKPFGGGTQGEGRSSGGRRDAASGSRGFGGARPPRRAPDGERPAQSFRPAGEGRSPRPGASAERRPFPAPSGRGESGPVGPKRPYAPRDREDRPRRDEGAARPYRPAAARGGASSERPRSDRGDRKPFSPRPAGAGDRPRRDEGYKPRTERGGTGAPRRDNATGPGTRKPYGDRPAGGARPFRPRADGEGTSFRREGKPGGDAPKRFASDADRPARPGASAAGSDEKRPRTARFTSSGKPRAGSFATGRPGPRTGRPAGKPARPGGPRKPGSGPGKPRKPSGPRKGPRRDG